SAVAPARPVPAPARAWRPSSARSGTAQPPPSPAPPRLPAARRWRAGSGLPEPRKHSSPWVNIGAKRRRGQARLLKNPASAALALPHRRHCGFQLGGGDLAVLVGVDRVEPFGGPARGDPLVLADRAVSVGVPHLD